MTPIFARLGRRVSDRLHLDTLRAKLQLAVALLMLGSLVMTLIFYTVSTNLTQTRLLSAETATETAQIAEALQARANALRSATRLLAADPQIAAAIDRDSEEALQTLNARAVLVRDRFSAGMVQIYNAEGDARTNLLLSSLYRESSLLDQIAPGEVKVSALGEDVILFSRESLSEGGGTVITGIDLRKELNNLVRQYRLAADVGIVLPPASGVPAGVPTVQPKISTFEDDRFPFDVREGRSPRYFSHHTDLTLGDSTLQLVVLRGTSDIRSISALGLAVMTLSLIITTGLLLSGSLFLMRALAAPIHNLSETANAVANGDFGKRAEAPSATFLKVGQDDELGLLTDSFNQMVGELQGLYNNLEDRVAARTRELAAAADVARTVSSSLDMNTILHQAARLIQQRLTADVVAVYLIDEDDSATLQEIAGEGYPLHKGETIVLASNTTVGTAARLHSACVIHDTEEATQYLPTTWFPRIRSIAAAPILAGSQVIGILELQSAEPRHFTTEITNLLSTLTDQIATGIQNARRYGDEQRRRRFTEVLELTGRILSGSLDMGQLPSRALSSLHALINYERAALWMAEGNRLVPKAQYGYADERPMYRKQITVDADIYRRFSQDKRPIIIDDLTTCEWQQKLWLVTDRSWMGVPIITAKGDVIGLVCLASSKTDDFNPDDAVWVQAFASQAGIALENAHLYAEIAALNQGHTDGSSPPSESVSRGPVEADLQPPDGAAPARGINKQGWTQLVSSNQT